MFWSHTEHIMFCGQEKYSVMVVLRIWQVHCFDLRKPSCLFLPFYIEPWAEYDVLITDFHIKIIDAESQ